MTRGLNKTRCIFGLQVEGRISRGLISRGVISRAYDSDE